MPDRRTFDRRRTIHSCLAQSAAQHADRTAVVSAGGRSVAYAELERRSNGFARRLAAEGVRRGDVVGLFLPRSAGAIVAMLGTLKAGAAFAPLDPAYPADHLAFIAADAGLRVVVTSEAMRAERGVAEAASWAGQAKLIDAESREAFDESALPEAGSGEDAAYVMYTSGTTGRPKGVVVPHRGVTRLAFNDFINLSPADVVMQFAPLSFDASTLEIWCPLLNGAAMAIVEAAHPSFAELGETIAARGVTTAWLTASLFHAIVDRQIEILRPLRQLLAGGDVLSPRHVRRVLDALPDCRLINGYGPTENTTFTCCHDIPRDHHADVAVPVGRPIQHGRVYVLGPDLRPVAPGEEGELFAAGEGVALGYLNRPELTAERFLVDPFCGESGRLMYRTGDLVRQRADGVVEFVGRVDRQVKICGKRVELDEVEALVRRLPEVADACAIVRAHTDGERQILAYVTARAGATFDAAGLRHSMLEASPDFMVPAAFVALAELPRTPNGKIDRAALPEPKLAEPESAASHGAPDSFEARLAALWGRILKAPDVGRDANFFDLGGASLDVMALQEEIKREFGLDTPMTALFEFTTVRSLAGHLQSLAASARRGHSSADRLAIDELADRKQRQAEALKRVARRRPAAAS